MSRHEIRGIVNSIASYADPRIEFDNKVRQTSALVKMCGKQHGPTIQQNATNANMTKTNIIKPNYRQRDPN